MNTRELRGLSDRAHAELEALRDEIRTVDSTSPHAAELRRVYLHLGAAWHELLLAVTELERGGQ